MYRLTNAKLEKIRNQKTGGNAGDHTERICARTDNKLDLARALVLSAATRYGVTSARPPHSLTLFKFVIASDGSIAGYFPPGQPDVAVVSCPNLGPANDVEFQSSLRSILTTARSAGKSKLVIDIRGNGGGNIIDFYDIFKQLFTSLTPYGATNLAAFELTNALGEVCTYQRAIGNLSNAALGPLTDYDVTEDLTIPLTDFES